MTNRTVKPFIALGMLIVLVGLACGGGNTADPTQPPAPNSGAESPTNPPPPTDIPAPTNLPAATDIPPATNEPIPTVVPPPAQEETATEIPQSNEPPAFYIEEFDADISATYSYFVANGVDGGTEMLFTANGALTFNIETQDTWVYVTYDPYVYTDVRIGLSAENRGKNSQNISLFCRGSSDGWFEFNLGGDGLYSILVYDALNDSYFNIANGGSTLIRIGRDTNDYIAECIGDTLNLYINGELAKSVTVPSDYRFMDEGQVGFSVSSFNSVPVIVNLLWFGIEEP